MAQNVYEVLFILDSNKYARDAGGVSSTIEEMVSKVEGQILASRLWVEQKLAYPIKGHRKGTYWLTYFRCGGDKLDQFNRLCQLNEHVLRHLSLRVDPRLVDALVSHALGQSKSTSDEKSESESSNGESAKPAVSEDTPEPETAEAK